MVKRWVFLCVLAVLLFPGLASRADLAAYLAKPEPVYRWEKQGEQKMGEGTIYDLHLVSQTWQGIVWEHRLLLYVPDKPLYPHLCTLMNTGGNGGARDYAMLPVAAKQTGGPFAILFNIPNQPLYGGKTEDALIVYTWQKFLETGDESWPLHFPMAKSVLKAMDALQAFTREAKLDSLDDFVVTGGSKRGWTAWLVGASRDPRVKGIAPMVIDTLNLAAQTPHQLAAFGKPSEQVADYTGVGMQDMLKTPAGQKLLKLEDPYSYRDILTLPKLILLGTNDRYWAQDALNLYWNGLKGPKWVMYTPNVGHNLGGDEDHLRVFASLGAFARSIASRASLPKPTWHYVKTASGADLTVKSDLPLVAASLWQVHADTQDFRDSRWTSEPISADPKGFTTHIPAPTQGYAAVYADLTYTVGDQTFHLTTQIEILPQSKQP
ncbi:MAG TPA: PhoPQ-activated protein PqaA family protein [Chthonomonadaceae bacterium]|nr:PhoPQ-activated protein PqaA family protein [Chthonomonadaceae bacterium]